MSVRSFSLFLVTLLILLPSISIANVTFEEGKLLFERGDYAQSVEVLERAFLDSPENLDISFYLGRALFEQGDYESAAVAFERVLIMQPDAARVKLELARTYLKLGSSEIAKQYFKNVQGANPPEAVWKQIQGFLDKIESDNRTHSFSGFVTLGLIYDDNVGAVPGDTINVGGLEFVLDQKPRSDAGLRATAVLNHVYRIHQTPYDWKSSLITFNNFYDDQTIHDLNYLGLSTGPVIKGDRTLWEIQGQVAQVDIDYDRYLGLYGLNLTGSYLATPHLLITFGVGAQEKDYFQDDYLDATNWRVLVNPVIKYGLNRLSLTLMREDENADNDVYSYQRAIAMLRYDRQLPMDLSAFGRFRYQSTDYEERNQIFNTRRADQQIQAEFGLSKEFWRSDDRSQALVGQLTHTYTSTDSNIELYEYDKNVTLASLTFAF